MQKIKNYHSAAYPALYVTTHEETRFMQDLLSYCKKYNSLCEEKDLTEEKKQENHLTVNMWDAQNGLQFKFGIHEKAYPETAETINLLKSIQNCDNGNTIFVLKDFHLHIDKVKSVRMLRNAWNRLKGQGNMIIFVGYKYALPPELEKEVQVLDYSLPDEASIAERLDYVIASANGARKAKNMADLEITEEIKESAVEAARGMTHCEVENAFSMAFCCSKKFDTKFVETVFQEKIAQLKKSGLLTYMTPDISFDNVGGLNGLKTWLTTRKKSYSKEARAYNLPLPKGMLLASVPGTGKSLICKAIAKEFDCPLFALDIGSVFDSLVGNSEKNMREIIKTIESIGKCVILIDEIEKSLSNSAVSGSGDSGVSSRIFGTFLTWLNDRNNPAFIVATTNNHTLLPAALIRKGRFDQLFWLDLPTSEERKEIFNVVIKKYKRDPKDFAIKTLVNGSEGFTGAEIEEVFKDALYKAFDAGEEISDSHVTDVLSEFIPFSVSHEEDLKVMRKQAQGKLVMVTSKGDPIADVEKNMRKLSIAIGHEE
jgi:SpoVK/Ycf46/Vps4 family AAA+-type ATPase